LTASQVFGIAEQKQQPNILLIMSDEDDRVNSSRALLRLVTQHHELRSVDGQLGISAPLVVGEFHLEYARREEFNSRTNLAANKAVLRDVDGQCDDAKSQLIDRQPLPSYLP
jgi:hypothetical protein